MVDYKVFLCGLDNAGKTTLANYIIDNVILKDPEPTRAFGIDYLILKGMDFIFWDAPGQTSYRKKWERGVMGSNFIMFVLDIADKERFAEAKKELDRVLEDYDTRGLPLIFCFHKMDLPDAHTNLPEAEATLKLVSIAERKVFPLKTSVRSGEGIEELKNLLVELVQKGRW